MATEETLTVEFDNQDFVVLVEHEAEERPTLTSEGNPESLKVLEISIGDVEISRFLDRCTTAAIERAAFAAYRAEQKERRSDLSRERAANSDFFRDMTGITYAGRGF